MVFVLISFVYSNPYVFGPSRSGSVIICTDSDPSINPQKSKKNVDFYYFLLHFNFLIFVGILSATDEAGAGSVSQWYGSADPDPYQNFTDPQHWF